LAIAAPDAGNQDLPELLEAPAFRKGAEHDGGEAGLRLLPSRTLMPWWVNWEARAQPIAPELMLVVA